MKKYISLLAIAATIGIISCSNKATSTNGEKLPLVENTTIHNNTSESDKIKISIDGKSFVFKLANNKTAAALLKIGSFETTAAVYHDNHYYGVTPKILPIDNASFVNTAKKGQLIYSQEYNGLGVFFEAGHFENNEFVIIGEVEGDISTLKASKGQVDMKIELIQKNKK
ncbi:MAG: cyclophilin-like fold protein [Candidatus Chryseobacterium colombiense]|nr:cyclophilin-like fold protein [Chryseobacterium sp.]WEK71181.1 MAG: cyclophilin-like fold protein [Chryseobacterium sp.]